MGQVSRRLAIWPTHGMLRGNKERKYKREELPYRGDNQKNQRKITV